MKSFFKKKLALATLVFTYTISTQASTVGYETKLTFYRTSAMINAIGAFYSGCGREPRGYGQGSIYIKESYTPCL